MWIRVCAYKCQREQKLRYSESVWSKGFLVSDTNCPVQEKKCESVASESSFSWWKIGGMNSFQALIPESVDTCFRKFGWEMVKLWPSTVSWANTFLSKYVLEVCLLLLWLIVLGFNDTSILVGPLPEKGRKKDSRRDEREEQEWKWRNRSNKNIPHLPLPATR